MPPAADTSSTFQVTIEPSQRTYSVSADETLLAGGIRSGQDVLKARALGAQGTLIGRSFLYGLGAYGQDGVSKALQIIQKELETTMAFCGHTNINTVTRDILLPGTFPKPY